MKTHLSHQLPWDSLVKNYYRNLSEGLIFPICECKKMHIIKKSDEIYERGKSQFDQLYNESKETTKIMAISIHPYLTGVPHRIKYLNKLLDYIISKDKVTFMTGEEIHNWYCDEVKISK